MILGVNGIRLVSARSGVARMIEAVLHSMAELDHPFQSVRVYSPTPIPDEVRLPELVTNVVVPSRLGPALWEQIDLPRAHGRAGLLFCPSYVIPVLATCPTFLVHHGSYEGYPQAFSSWVLNKARVAYALSAWRATGVSTVSEYSRQDMRRYYGIPTQRVHVVPEGVDTTLFRPIADPARRAAFRREFLGGDHPYIAYVGKPTERRNLTPCCTPLPVFVASGVCRTRC